MLPNWLIFDKQYRILRCLKFEDPINYFDLQRMSGIETKKFVEIADYLGKIGYISLDSETFGVTLYCISSLREYKAALVRLIFEISVSVSAVVVAVTSVIAVILQYKELLQILK